MRQLFVIILVSLLLVQPLSLTWIYASFLINRDYIAQNLCVKKEIRGNTCKGCCQLKKQLKQSNEQEQKSLPQGIRVKAEQIFCARSSSFGFKKQFAVLNTTCVVINAQEGLATGFLYPVFHPPRIQSQA